MASYTRPTNMPTLPPDRVTDRHLRALVSKGTGKMRVAHGLYFIARSDRRPSWEFRYTSPDGGKRRSFVIGRYPDLGLAEARNRTAEYRQQVADGIDPIEARNAARREAEWQRDQAITLREAATELHKRLRPTWKNDKHATQWLSSLEQLGALLDRPLATITSAELLAQLEHLNQTHHETAKRIRQRVEAIYDRAIVQGRVRENPATPIKRELRAPKQTRHHAALNWRELPDFLARLRDSDAAQSTRLGFEWLILAAARTNEVTGATWAEIDADRQIWTIPAVRMKVDGENRDHHVPITDRMRDILKAMENQRGEWPWLFPSPQRRRQSMSNGAFLALIRRMGLAGRATGHGMRSTYSTWAYETQHVRSDVVEASLAHVEEETAKAAYNRAEYWAERVRLAQAWTDYACRRRNESSTP